MTREEAIKILKAIRVYECYPKSASEETKEAIDMAIEALSKPNYESDTEVRLAVTDRNKDKVVLWDAFGEVEYYQCDKSETRFYDEDDYWNGRVPTAQAKGGDAEMNEVKSPYMQQSPNRATHGRLIDADALALDAIRWSLCLGLDCSLCPFYRNGVCGVRRMINDAPTVSVVDIVQRDLCEDINCEDCPFLKGTCKLMDCVAYADRPHGEWIADTENMTLNCSLCGEQFKFDDVDEMLDYKEYAHFCIHCGSDMKERRET